MENERKHWKRADLVHRQGYFCLNLGSKLALAAVFVTLRAKEYHMTLTEVLKKVSVSNLGHLVRKKGGETEVSHGSV